MTCKSAVSSNSQEPAPLKPHRSPEKYNPINDNRVAEVCGSPAEAVCRQRPGTGVAARATCPGGGLETCVQGPDRHSTLKPFKRP